MANSSADVEMHYQELSIFEDRLTFRDPASIDDSLPDPLINLTCSLTQQLSPAHPTRRDPET